MSVSVYPCVRVCKLEELHINKANMKKKKRSGVAQKGRERETRKKKNTETLFPTAVKTPTNRHNVKTHRMKVENKRKKRAPTCVCESIN